MVYIRLVWDVTFKTLFSWPFAAKVVSDMNPGNVNAAQETVNTISMIAVSVGLLSAFVHTVWKRNKYTAALFVFLIFFISVHALREATHQRYEGW